MLQWMQIEGYDRNKELVLLLRRESEKGEK